MKKLILALAVLLVLFSLAACGEKPEAPSPSESTSGELPPPAPEAITVFSEGVSQYKLIRPDAVSDEIKNAVIKLHQAMNQKYGIIFPLATDFEKRDFDVSTRYQYEIVVGATNRDESMAAMDELSYNESLIRVDGTRLVIAGGNDAATVRAIEYFIENCLTDGTLAPSGQLYRTPTGELGYVKDSLKLDGVDISDFKLVYAANTKQAATKLAEHLGMLCGAVVSMENEASDKAEHEIVIGATKRGVDSSGLGADDFKITAKDGSIYIAGGSVNAIATGAKRLVDQLAQGGNELSTASLELSYTLPDRQEYINDISKLALNWELYFDAPDWMLDFDEKYNSLIDTSGRLMSCLHRGDMQNYPENSIEGIISAIRMGGDMIEIDPRKTKDGVFVLLHDATLNRTTDFTEKAGKDGLPTSPNVYDWTYEQLLRLNLKTGSGGDGAKVTDYKIPTLEEAIKVSAGRIFIRLDVKTKTGADGEPVLWNYNTHIWPLLEKYNAEINVIFTWHSAFTSGDYNLVKKYKALQLEACGREGIFFIGCNASKTAKSILTTIKNNSFDPCVRLTDYDNTLTYLDKNASKLAAFKGKARLYIDAPHDMENAETWEKLNDAGINLLLVNRGLDLCKLIESMYDK